ncbi:MAG: ferrous iron transport protein A, partial [Nakamurella sp.]
MPVSPATFLSSVPIGQRVVARYRITGGLTDALGYLRARDESSCVIET